MMKLSDADITAYNRPYQSMIKYCAKGYDEFRKDLIKRLEKKGFKIRQGDIMSALIDLAAYLGEVTATYQNAYAQEVYLETAQLRESLGHLAVMVDYRIDPGAAAKGTLIVYAKPGESGLLKKGFQVSGKDKNATTPVYFETDQDLQANALYNEMSLARTERYLDTKLDSNLTVTGGISAKPGQYLYFHRDAPSLDLFFQLQSSVVDEATETTKLTWGTDTGDGSDLAEDILVSDGAWSLIPPDSLGVLKIATEANSKTGNFIWLDNKYKTIESGSPIVVSYREEISTSGTSDTPSIPEYEQKIAYGIVKGLAFENVVVKTSTSTRIVEVENDTYDLDDYEDKVSHYTIEVAKESVDDTEEDGEDDTSSTSSKQTKTYWVIETTHVVPREVVRLEVNWRETIPPNYYDTEKYFEASKVHLVLSGVQEKLTAVAEEVNTSKIETYKIDGDISGLEVGRPVILYETIDNKRVLISATVDKAIKHDTDPYTTLELTLNEPIGTKFTRSGVRIWANVVSISQGQLLASQTLGSGKGNISNQSFELAKSPLAYHSKSREGIVPSISINVGDLPWTRQDGFMASKPEDRHYVVETMADGKSSVVFGDGILGSKLPTGRDNVKADYRIGQGASGNVSADTLIKPTSKPSFLKKVSNPGQTLGGANPDSDTQIREKIPVGHLTMGRVVSLQDYLDTALLYPGVGKAKAIKRWIDGRRKIILVITGEEGKEVENTDLKNNLRDYLDGRRDVSQPLVIRGIDIVPIKMEIEFIVCPNYDSESVTLAVIKALGNGVNADGSLQFFHFDRLKIGMSIHQKDVYLLLESVPGMQMVTSLTMTRESKPNEKMGKVVPVFSDKSVWIYEWELARLSNELRVSPSQAPEGKACIGLRG